MVVVDGMGNELSMEHLDRGLTTHSGSRHVSEGRVLGLIVSAVRWTRLTLLRLLTSLSVTGRGWRAGLTVGARQTLTGCVSYVGHIAIFSTIFLGNKIIIEMHNG